MTTTATNRVTRGGLTCVDPVMLSGEQRCPPGAAIVSILGNASGGAFSSDNSVRIVCAQLATDGTVTTAGRSSTFVR